MKMTVTGTGTSTRKVLRLYRIYNAPRMGMCGYDGPAEPPY